MSNRDHRTGGPGLRILLSRATVSRRGFLLSSLAGATGLAIEAGRAPAMAAEGSVRSLTYSGQRWGAVQEAMAPAFTKATGIQTKIITFPISQGYARILTPLGIGSSEYDLIELDYGILAQVADKLTPLDAYLQKDAAYKAEYESSVSANVRGLYQFDGARLGKGTTYGIANDANTQLGFYRADVFEKAGIKAPRDLGRSATGREGADRVDGRRQAVRLHHQRQARDLFVDVVWPGAVQLWRQLARR